MQDNAPPHQTNITRQLTLKNDNNLTPEWPSVSPDMNSIENCVWSHMKRQLKKRNYASILDTLCLFENLRDVWKELSNDYVLT